MNLPRSPYTHSAINAFGRIRTKQVLVWLLLFIMVCAAALLWTLQGMLRDVAIRATTRQAETIAASIHKANFSLADARVAFPNAKIDIATASDTGDKTRDALFGRLRAQPQKTVVVVDPVDDPRSLVYGVTLTDGRHVLIEQSLEPHLSVLTEQFARIFLIVGVAVCLCVASFMLLLAKAQREIRSALAAQSLSNETSRRHATPLSAAEDRNRLPVIFAFTLLVFSIDVWQSVSAVAGAAYAIAVMWSLSSNRRWHIGATVAWTLALHFAASLLNPPSDELKLTLSLHALVTFVIAAIAAYGLGLSKRVRSESMAAARAALAQDESAQSRAALERIEAADARMRTALDRLTLATQYAGISVWEWDLVADLIYAAEGSDFGARLGFNTHLRGGEYVRNFVHPDDRDNFAAAFRPAITGEKSDGKIEHRYRSQAVDGTMQYIQLHARVYRDERGHAVRIVGVDWNVTREVEATLEGHRHTEQLRDAERRLERASLSSMEGHWETDLLSGQAWISSSFRELLGFVEGEFEAMQITAPELAHPDDRAKQEAVYLAHLQRNEPYDLQLRLCTARGEYRWYRLHGAAERDSDGRPIRMSGSIQDIHQRHSVEDALKDAQARFVRAINGTQDGFYDLDIINDTVWFSPRYKKMLGYEEHEHNIKVSELPEHVHPDDRELTAKTFVDLVKYRLPYDVQFRLRKKNGEYLWVRSRAEAEFARDGRAIRASGSVQDVTDTRQAREELLQATAVAEAANEAKSTFLATMSHEIRTPMNGVIGMTGLLLDTELNRVQREYANTIRTSADSLLHVINDILDFSKIEAGKFEIDVTDMDLRTNIEDVCAMMALQAATKRLEVIVDIRPEVPEMVRGDAQRIRQCVLNLLSNAVKFTAAGEIVVEVCVLAQQVGKTLLQFSVRDTGIGLSAQQIGNLFQPFVQADASTTKHFGGTGLGLSIVKRLIELMGGQVGVESQLGQGATFWFTLPLEPLDPSGHFLRLSTSTLGKRALIVDDNATNRNVMQHQLTRMGFEVELAADGPEALTLFKKARELGQKFDVALLDFQMPAMDGAMLGEIINADAALADTRLVLLTSLDRAGDQQRFAAIGFAAYLTKPVRARELKECLDRVLASEARDWHLAGQPIITRNSLTEAYGDAHYGGRVLLVEDNPVNQQVAQKCVERLGCQVFVVEDGLAGVNAFKEGNYDLILMDMQMPVMDGVTATKAIRSLERGGKHTPIVALTANVMAGQLERCLEAGMDDFLAKPLDVRRLRDVLDRFGLASGATHLPLAQDPEAPLDFARIESIAGDDKAFIDELFRAFIESTTETLGVLRDTLAKKDFAAAAREAHKLKGASGNIGAHRLQELARQLEASAARSDEQTFVQEMEKIVIEAQRVQDFMQPYLQ